MNRLLLLAGLLALGGWPFAGAAEVYRCVSETGVVSYSDKPCGENAQRLAIQNQRTDGEAVQERVENRKEQIKSLQEAEAESAQAAERAQQEAEKRKQQCAAARERLQKLVVARRVTTGEGDERRYLEDEEIIERRQQAQDQVNELCGG